MLAFLATGCAPQMNARNVIPQSKKSTIVVQTFIVTGSSDSNSVIIADYDSNHYGATTPGILDTYSGVQPTPKPCINCPPQLAKPRIHKSSLVVFTSCTQWYTAQTPGVHNPAIDTPLGPPSCTTFTMGSAGPVFSGNLGGSNTTIPVACQQPDQFGHSYGCSTTARCRSDYAKDMKLAPQLVAARLALLGYTGATLATVLAPVIAQMAAGAGASAIAAWVTYAGGAGGAASLVVNLLTNMTPKDALATEAAAAALHQDELNNGCTVDGDPYAVPPIGNETTYTMTPGGGV